ncbi:MAG: Holliday junction resolvase Hjc [Candidatus Woesearchaeota archaeon]
MSLKSKGIAAERELVHLLQKYGFAAIRVAGSGSTVTPSTDVIAGNSGRIFSFECKTIKGESRYISKKQIEDFLSFSGQFGAECWIAVRFSRKPWKFLLVEDLVETPNNYGITKKIAEIRGITLEELLQMSHFLEKQI